MVATSAKVWKNDYVERAYQFRELLNGMKNAFPYLNEQFTVCAKTMTITEEMVYRARLCEYTMTYGVTKVARRCHTNRQFVYRQLAKYDGTPRYGNEYYQITAIDEWSRKRVLSIVRERSTYETAEFLEKLEEALGFPIYRIQMDNGREFVNDREETSRLSAFEFVC